ncbi:hypothetical protein O9992_21770 [Vibrio lentus]|nr:hypothetical protein [Vibrio lentus]
MAEFIRQQYRSRFITALRVSARKENQQPWRRRFYQAFLVLIEREFGLKDPEKARRYQVASNDVSTATEQTATYRNRVVL